MSNVAKSKKQEPTPKVTRLWESAEGMAQMFISEEFGGCWFLLEYVSPKFKNKNGSRKYATVSGLLKRITTLRQMGYKNIHMTVTYKKYSDLSRETLVITPIDVVQPKFIYLNDEGVLIFSNTKPLKLSVLKVENNTTTVINAQNVNIGVPTGSKELVTL
jgi:hypothetical protein